MNIHPVARLIILISAILLLLAVAWLALSGGISQLPRSVTIGQQVETTVQLACALLSFLSAFTCFYWKRLRRAVRVAWIISLTTAAGLSSIVWGPSMPGVGLAIAAFALLVGLAIIWLLRIAVA